MCDLLLKIMEIKVWKSKISKGNNIESVGGAEKQNQTESKFRQENLRNIVNPLEAQANN